MLAVAVTVAATALCAQEALEIIPLRHRTVDQVLPVLRPLIEPGGTLTGQSNQLIVRASPANMAQIRSALEAIDRPARRLQISVRFDNASQASRQGIEASGRVGGRDAQVDIRAQDTRRDAHERVDQRLQVLEGGRAFISTGQTRTLPQRQIIQTPAGAIPQQTFVVQETATGFEVVPRISGASVILEIAPQREVAGPGGTVQSQRIATTVSARLGDWVDLGGATQSAMRDERGIGSASRSTGADSRGVWLKVEELTN
jgi:type II secretory pathway component GspD/PulD (secretin)